MATWQLAPKKHQRWNAAAVQTLASVMFSERKQNQFRIPVSTYFTRYFSLVWMVTMVGYWGRLPDLNKKNIGNVKTAGERQLLPIYISSIKYVVMPSPAAKQEGCLLSKCTQSLMHSQEK